MRKPGKVLSIIGLILSAALLVVGSYFILPRSQNWASIWSVLTGSAAAYFAYYALHKSDKDGIIHGIHGGVPLRREKILDNSEKC